MNILVVSMDNSPWAGRSHEIKVAEEFCRQGHTVQLVTERQPLWTPQSPKPEGIQSVTVAPVNDPSQANQIAKMLPSCDVAFASSVSGAPILAAWKTMNRKPVVTQVLDVPLWRLFWMQKGPWFDQWQPWHSALYEMDHLIANTKQTQDDLGETKKYYQESRPMPKSTVVYYGIDVEEADKAKPHPRQPDEYPMAVGVSRLVPYKGFDLAIASLALQEKPVAYYVIGDGEDLLRLVQFDQLINGTCTFTGGIPDNQKFEIIKTADFGLFLAFNRHIPAQFPMEAVYCGKPTIVADIPINRERFQNHGVYYVNPADTRGVAAAIETCVDERDVLWPPEEMQRHAEWVRQNRSFQSHAKGVLDVLGGLTR